MGRFKLSSLATAAVIGLGGFAAPAFADQLYVDGVATNPGLNTNLRSNVTLTYNVDGKTATNVAEYAVQILLTVNQGSSPGTPTFVLPVWCVDIFHDIFVPSSGEIYTEGPLNTDNSGDHGAGTVLTDTQKAEIGALVSYGNYLMSHDSGNTAALDAAEVQSAIWTVEYNNGSNTLAVTSNGSYFRSSDIDTTISNAMMNYGGSTAGQLLDDVQAEAYAAPAPSIGRGLPVVLAVGSILFGASLPRRSNRRRSLGAANPYPAG